VLRTNIHGCENAFDIDRNADIEDSYIHDLYQSAVAHTDGLQAFDGSNLTLKHNTFEGDTYPCPADCSGTSAVNIYNARTSWVRSRTPSSRTTFCQAGRTRSTALATSTRTSRS
jgi:hypothetical protein